MPQVLSYTPSWLSRPSPGFDIFSKPRSRLSPSPRPRPANKEGDITRRNPHYVGPRRTIARRGTEIFVLVGNEIRWSELCMLKDDWEELQTQREQSRTKRRTSATDGIADADNDRGGGSSHRVLKVPVSEQIRQLIPSPNGDFLAILTSHTVHIAVLPDSSHLGQQDTGPIRLKTHTLGPTTHVLAQPPIISALWHPLGVCGSCLLTVTAEAVVRIWELSIDNRWSFDSPTLTIDMKKLADATSSEDDLGASGIGSNRGFSPDSVEMEVAAACFGGAGLEEENGWASMTLWVAMREGDVYALCPLLPSKWQPPPTLIPSLSTSVVAKAKALQHDISISEEERRDCDHQYTWFSEIDTEDPQILPGRSEFAPEMEIYSRPAALGPISKLQGPFQLQPEPDEPEIASEIPLTDIFVIGAKVDADDLLLNEDASDLSEIGREGLSVGVICLVSSNSRVHVCLDFEGVEGKWLPKKRTKLRYEDSIPPSLLVLESLDTQPSSSFGKSSWPLFTSDPASRYSFFLTHGSMVSYLSFTPWLEKLEEELQSTANAGVSFRLDVVLQRSSALRQRIILNENEIDEDKEDYSACLAFQDSDLGLFVLTTADGQPHAAILSQPALSTDQDPTEVYVASQMQALLLSPPRNAYQPSPVLWASTSLASFLDTHVHSRHKRNLKTEIRLSPATLDLMTSAHRVLSQETHNLGVGAADLFRRCDRLVEEFKDHIGRARDLATRIELVVAEEADQKSGSQRIEQRLANVMRRQEELARRQDALRRKVLRMGGKQLSEREVAWRNEAKRIESQILKAGDEDADEDQNDEGAEGDYKTWRRFEEVMRIKQELTDQVKDLTEKAERGDSEKTELIPSEIRRAKVAQVMGLLERESALVDATARKLDRLSLSL